MPSALEIAIRESRRRIAEGETPIRAMLADAYARTIRNLDADLTLVTLMIEDARAQGIEVSPDWLRRQDRYIRLMAQADREFTRFADDGMRIIEQGRIRAVRGGAAEAWELMEASGITPGFDARINTRAVENALAAAYDGPLSRTFARYGTEGAQTITDTLLDGIARGHSPRRIQRDIQRGLTSPANMARLEATVRTQFMEANRRAMNETYASMSHLIAGYRRTEAKSPRTCLPCVALDGHVQKEPHTDWHICCRGIDTPVPKGSTYKYETGEQWFNRQSDDVKRRMLPTDETFQAYQSGRIKLSDFVGRHNDTVWGKSVYQRSGRSVLERASVPKAPRVLSPTKMPTTEPELLSLMEEVERASRAMPSLRTAGDLEQLADDLRVVRAGGLSGADFDDFASWYHADYDLLRRAQLGPGRVNIDGFGVSADQANSSLRNSFDAWRASVTADERNSLVAYKATDYSKINKVARGTQEATPAITRHIDNLDSALDRSVLEDDMRLYRGFGTRTQRDEWINARPGQVITDPGFVSTTYKADKSFGGGTTPYQFKIEILAPKGTRGLYIDPYGSDDQTSAEGEVLLPRGMSFLVRQVKKVRGTADDPRGTYHILLEVIP